MTYASRPDERERIDIDETVVCTHGADDPFDDHNPPEIAFLVARFDRAAADQMRSRRYQRRSNTITPGFRRHQRAEAFS